jgi:hypothetical protein
MANLSPYAAAQMFNWLTGGPPLFAVVRHPRALREVLHNGPRSTSRLRCYTSVTEIQKNAIRCYRYFVTMS